MARAAQQLLATRTAKAVQPAGAAQQVHSAGCTANAARTPWADKQRPRQAVPAGDAEHASRLLPFRTPAASRGPISAAAVAAGAAEPPTQRPAWLLGVLVAPNSRTIAVGSAGRPSL
eukprot:366494-Chlamydomonas_euryale.AAC.8